MPIQKPLLRVFAANVLIALLAFSADAHICGQLFREPVFPVGIDIRGEAAIRQYQFFQAMSAVPTEQLMVPLEHVIGDARDTSDLSDLVGQFIVGHIETREAGRTDQTRYLKGTVTAVKVRPYVPRVPRKSEERWPHDVANVELTLEQDGKTETILAVRPSQNTIDYYPVFWSLQKKLETPSELRRHFLKRWLDQNLEWLFGSPILPRDYDVAVLALETYLTLPTSFGVTGTVNTLRGSSKATEHPNFGVLASDKRYSKVALMEFTRNLENWMLAHHVVSKDRRVANKPWVQQKDASPLASTMLELVQEWRVSAAPAPRDP